MRFQIRHPDGGRQTIELEPPLAIVGRDPGCDLVLRDPKCSRRHAVIEQTPSATLVRDSGSVNGLFVNGQRVERALLHPGDEIRIGEIVLLHLPDDPDEEPPLREQKDLGARGAAPEADDLRDAGVATAPPFPRPVRREAPLTLSTLAAIWIVAAPLFLLASGALVARSGRFGYRQMLLLAGGALLALLALTLALGLHAAAGWARALHLALCLPLAMTCVFAPFAVVAAAYLLGARTRRHFTAPDGTPWPTAHDPRLERRFALSLAAAALLSVVLALAADLALRSAPGSETPVPPPGAAPVLARLRAMHSAQESFRRVCNLGFGDLEGLTNPASVLPGYPPHGPSFLAQDLVSAQDHGYRFALAVGGLMPPTSDCSTLRRYRIFEYTAAPLSGTGSFFRLSADGAIRVAEGRPARGGDPVLEQLR